MFLSINTIKTEAIFIYLQVLYVGQIHLLNIVFTLCYILLLLDLLYSNINFNKTNEIESKNVVTYSMLS